MISLSLVNPKENGIIIGSVSDQCYSVSVGFNEAFEFIFKNDYLDLFNLNLEYCISSPLWLHSTSVISLCTI